MVESLRRHGGRFADVPVWAITPRYGPRLTNRTLEQFSRLNVTHHTLHERGSYSWYNLWNKIASMNYAEAHAQTDYLGFIDSDILLTGEPEQLIASDFAARIHAFKHIGTTGPGDPKEAFWAEICRIAGVELDDLPWVQTRQDKERIRLYFNSGVFTYRRGLNFAKLWAEICLSILDARIGEAESKSFFVEQVSLGLALTRSGLGWKPLPAAYNYDVASWDVANWEENDDAADFAEAISLHYHDSMKPHFWPQFLELLRISHPQLYQWLSLLEPATDSSSKSAQLLAKSLKIKRVAQRNKYHSQCKLI